MNLAEDPRNYRQIIKENLFKKNYCKKKISLNVILVIFKEERADKRIVYLPLGL